MAEISKDFEMILTVISGMRKVSPLNAEEIAYNNALGDVFDYIIKNEAEHLEPHTIRCGLWVRDGQFSRADVVRYFFRQGILDPTKDMVEFMLYNKNYQAQCNEAIKYNYSYNNVRRWIHLIDVLGREISFEAAMKVDEALEKHYTDGSKKYAICVSFSSHDCEAHYKCPECNGFFGSWTVFNQEPNENNTKHYCPHCKAELEGLE